MYEFFVSEEGLLFPRKWDRSSWTLLFRVDRGLDTIEVNCYGVHSPKAEVIRVEGPLQRPCASWSYVLEHAVTGLRDQLQYQLDDSLP
jgi:hypothetical protein